MNDYNSKHKPRLGKNMKLKNREIRANAIELLGGKCQHCGESDSIVLDFDHINNDGAAHRRIVGSNMARTVLKEPERFQLLCKNCNWRKEHTRRTAPCLT